MQTSKLISTISYNSPVHLQGTLFRLVKAGVLEYAHWVQHKAEADEKKDHIHVVMKPNRRLDTSAIRNQFEEIVIGQDKPLGVLPFKSTSRMSDWMLYSAHDINYLLKKGEVREHHYRREDFHSTEPDLLDEDWRECHKSDDSKVPILAEYAKLGKPWVEVVKANFLPVNQLFQYKEIFFTLLGGLERGKGERHE